MFYVRIECEKISVEKLAELLFIYSRKLNVWFYNKKAYASFLVESVPLLKSLIKTLEANKIKFRFHRIGEVNEQRIQENFT